jgi:hypothetical protein
MLEALKGPHSAPNTGGTQGYNLEKKITFVLKPNFR